MSTMTKFARGAVPLLVLSLLAGPSAAAEAVAPSVAATPPHVVRHHRTIHRHPAPRAAIAPLQAAPAPVASAVSAAPVPNENVAQPRSDQPTQDTSVQPSVFQLHYPPQGDGYVTGSSPQAMDDRNAAKATGVQVQVPLGH